LSRVPLMSQNFWMGDPLQVQSTRYTEPIPNVNGRNNRIWTAEGLGGASRINAMLLTRGVPGGYKQWAEEFGFGDWACDRVKPYFRKSENVEGHPNSSWRGRDGRGYASTETQNNLLTFTPSSGPIPIRQSFPPFKWCH
jgi:choline dehydrogenase-like flavoprotein